MSQFFASGGQSMYVNVCVCVCVCVCVYIYLYIYKLAFHITISRCLLAIMFQCKLLLWNGKAIAFSEMTLNQVPLCRLTNRSIVSISWGEW